jgi:hypothetical protein
MPEPLHLEGRWGDLLDLWIEEATRQPMEDDDSGRMPALRDHRLLHTKRNSSSRAAHRCEDRARSVGEVLFSRDAGSRHGLSRLMRHAQVSITMNVYGSAYMEGKREARSKVVQMVLPRANEKAATAMAASYLSCPRQSDCGLGIR